MATLMDLVAEIDTLAAEDVVFAKPEWNELSEARVFQLTDDFRPPPEAGALGYAYLLEVDLIRQVLEEFTGTPDATLAEKCRRIIQYATFDA